jgi:hypothetical protein
MRGEVVIRLVSNSAGKQKLGKYIDIGNNVVITATAAAW